MAANKVSGGAAVVEVLKAQGVDTVFGLLGGSMLELYDALYDDSGIRYIGARDERAAGHMADAMPASPAGRGSYWGRRRDRAWRTSSRRWRRHTWRTHRWWPLPAPSPAAISARTPFRRSTRWACFNPSASGPRWSVIRGNSPDRGARRHPPGLERQARARGAACSARSVRG